MKTIRSYIGAAGVFLLAVLAIVGCSSADLKPADPAPEVVTQSLTEPSCTTDAQCQATSPAPGCADMAHAFCVGTTCHYPISKTNTACMCVVGDKRTCPALGAGLQACVVSGTGSDWGTACTGTYSGTQINPVVSCTTTADCESWANYPYGASSDRCLGPTGAKHCVFEMDTHDMYSLCVERDVRDCIGGFPPVAAHMVCKGPTTPPNFYDTHWSQCTP